MRIQLSQQKASEHPGELTKAVITFQRGKEKKKGLGCTMVSNEISLSA